ncbi:hypothetical protein D3C85_444520 [compost metagenome]
MQRVASGVKGVTVIVEPFSGQQGTLTGRGQRLVPTRRNFTRDVEAVYGCRKTSSECFDAFGIEPVILTGPARRWVQVGEVRTDVELR